ncbi:MAG TPA: trypsin-like peptidase domain-containing protein [Solirubrobacterales bacterium]|nr:trypsin-like peptidase domain-containing protein [Solirubrobacterales bacterium]
MRARALAGAAALAIALAGCGGSDNGGANSSAQVTTVTEAVPQVAVQTAEHGFDPAKVFREASPGVVTIRSVFRGEGGSAEGSGFVLDSSGKIVTNAHVVTDESTGSRKTAKEVFIEFPDRNTVPAKIVGFDPFADVALLEIEPDGFKLHPLQLGDDNDLVVGQPVAAIGSPFGEQQSLSVGVVSATDRSVESLTKFQIEGAIQTDASINPGNSGGPLLDAGARVLGINEQIETNSGSNSGVGFAVPVSAIKRSVAQLEEKGEAEYAYIGVTIQSVYPQLADKLHLDTDHGGLISEVISGGPADKAGLRGGDSRLTFQAIPYETGGDVILSVDGHPIVQPEDLARLISLHQPGDTVRVEILRDGNQHEEVDVTLGKRPGG